MGHLKRVLITAGGTGGHVFPGLAVAKALQSEGVEVRWLGSTGGFEVRPVTEAGIGFDSLSISGWRGKGWLSGVMAPLKLMVAVFQALRVIRRFKPDLVLGMGGFVSGPAGIASVLLQCPLAIHEQNAIPGMTNKWLSHCARRVFQAFPASFSKKGVITTGNPVRQDIIEVGLSEKNWPAGERPLQVLVLGGSRGAVAINRLLPVAIAAIPTEKRPQVWHQSGERYFSDTLCAFKSVGLRARVEPFIPDMKAAYGWADVVVCRAGALTVSELCAAGRGGLLVPYPYAVDDHQAVNASFMVKEGAAEMIRQSELDAARLTSVLLGWIESPDRCRKMGDAALRLSRRDATTNIVKICQEMGH